MRKTNQPSLISKKLQEAIVGFVPEFGSENDIRILKDIEKVQKKLRNIDHVTFREYEAKKEDRYLTSKMQEIQRDERSLINRINQQKLDL